MGGPLLSPPGNLILLGRPGAYGTATTHNAGLNSPAPESISVPRPAERQHMAQTPGRNTATWARLRRRLRADAEKRGDRCWICGGEIDYLAPAHHPDAWEPDHVRPVSTHPELAEDPANIRSSHASCNNARGSGGTATGLGARRARLR